MKIEAINKGSEAKALAFPEFLGCTLPDDLIFKFAHLLIILYFCTFKLQLH